MSYNHICGEMQNAVVKEKLRTLGSPTILFRRINTHEFLRSSIEFILDTARMEELWQPQQTMF